MPGHPPPLHEPIDDHGVRLFCPAKINLALSLGSPRNDGLHPIASWMVPIAFGDTLELRRSEGPNQFAINFAEDAPQRMPVDWPLTSDLAYRAWQAVRDDVGRPLPISARLVKRVPAGAGLGGGSADAAAMLDGLDRLFALGLDEERLQAIAATLGADVVFQFRARRHRGGAFVTGTGEKIEMLPAAPPRHILLVLPGFGCTTAEVYGAYDAQLDGHDKPLAMSRVRALASGDGVPPASLFNDLTEPARAVQPALADVLGAARAAGFVPHVTGSGAAVFILTDTLETHKLEQQQRILSQATGCPVIATHTAG